MHARYHDARAELRETLLFLIYSQAFDREVRGSSVGWDFVAAINSKPPTMAVFLRKLRSCGVKEAVSATCQKACPTNVAGTKKANNATAASRG